MKKLAAILLYLFVFAGYALADSNAGAFLETGFGARAQGMGGAFTAFADDANSVMYNSAGLAGLHCIQFTTMFSKLYDEIDHNYFAMAIPLGTSDTLGLGYVSTGVDGIPQTGWDNLISRKIDTGKTFDYGANAFVASYGRSIYDNFDLGFSLKYLTEELATNNATGIGADIGALYHFNSETKVGLNVKNVIKPVMDWSTGNDEDSVPLSFVLGGYTKVKDISLALDLEYRENRDLKYMLGSEYYYIDTFAFRAGLSNKMFTLGAGLKYSNIIFDYAYIDSTDDYLETNHSFSIGYLFPCEKKKEKLVNKQLKPIKETVITDLLSDTINVPVVNPVGFPDMEGHWGQNSVENVAGVGIFSGRPNGLFDPNGYMKKAEMAKVLLASYRVKANASTAMLSVKVNSGVEKTIINAQVINSYKSLIRNLKVTKVSSKEFLVVWDGYDFDGKIVDDGKYYINMKVKELGRTKTKNVPVYVNQQVVRVSLPGKNDSGFLDVSSTHWASGIIKRAKSIGIIKGESEIIFNPDKIVTRLDFIMGIAGALRKDGFTVDPDVVLDYNDSYLIPEDAYEDIELYASVLGFGGDKNGNLNPNAPLRRVEALVLVERYLKTSKLINSVFSVDSKSIENVAVEEIDDVVISDSAKVSIDIVTTNSGKVIYKGNASGIVGSTIDKSVVALRKDGKFFRKISVANNQVVKYVVKVSEDSFIDIEFTYLENKVIIRGSAPSGSKMTLNNKAVYIKPNGKFFKKLIGKSSNLFNITYEID